MNPIRDKYIPFVVKNVLKNDSKTIREYTDEDFVQFCQALYDKIKERELEVCNDN